MYGESQFQAIEVKNASRIHSRDLRALKTFRQDYPEAKGIMLYRGREQLRVDGIWCLPVDDFLRDLIPNTPHTHQEPKYFKRRDKLDLGTVYLFHPA